MWSVLRLIVSYFAVCSFLPAGFQFTPRLWAQATFSPIVMVGPGYVDCYTRQVVRTSGDIVYVVLNASGFDGGTAVSSVRVYKGSPAGNPTSFAEMDATHRPGNNVRTGGVEAKIAGTDPFIQIVYEDEEAAQARYVRFDTRTDTWGAPEVVGSLNGVNTLNRYMGRTGLALDSSGLPHVITGGTNEPLYYTNRVGGAWSAPVVVAGSSSWMHPSMAFDRSGILHVAFYDHNASMLYRNRSAAGTWSTVETITTGASTSASDESPSLAIDSTGRILVAYIAGDFSFHYQLARRTAANNWTDISPTAAVAGHSPGVFIDTADKIFAMEGHDLTAIQPSVEIRSAAGAWGPYQILATSPPTRDGSASARWDLLWPGNTAHLDWVNMDEAGVDANGAHYGISYYLHGALSGTSPSPTPTPTPTPQGPDFSLTLPAASITITAGQSTNLALTLAASGGFNQTVSLSCAGAPAESTCVASPSSVNPNGGTVTAQISITSSPRTTGVLLIDDGHHRWLGWALAGLLFTVVALTFMDGRVHRPRMVFASVAFALVFLGPGCSGGAASANKNSAGTPAGSYTLTITGTSGNQSRSAIMTLVVK